MAQNQPVKAIDVIPSNIINIPQPGKVAEGSSSTNGTTLTDASGAFLDDQLSGGDVVYVNNTAEIHEILSVDDNQTITLKTAVGAAAPYNYKVYKSNGGALKQGQLGYSLFVGTAGDLTVFPVGVDETVTLKNVANNSYVPLQVQRVLSSGTTAADILALE